MHISMGRREPTGARKTFTITLITLPTGPTVFYSLYLEMNLTPAAFRYHLWYGKQGIFTLESGKGNKAVG
jgi:hypothetical protein